MSVLNADVQLRTAQWSNGETIQDAKCAAPPNVVYKTAALGASTDPFAGKANKYAESKLVRVVGSGAFHVKFGDVSIAAAAVTDRFVPANTIEYIAIDDSKAYMRIIQNSGTPDVYIEEVY